MTLLWCDGFDHYGTDETKLTDGVYASIGSNFTLSTSGQRTDNGCIIRDSSKDSSGLVKRFTSSSSVGVGVAINASQLPSNTGTYELLNIRDENGSIQISFYLEKDGSIVAKLGDRNSIIARSDANVFDSGIYQHLEIAVIADNDILVESSGFCGNIDSLMYTGNSLDVSSETTTPWDSAINFDESKLLIHTKPFGLYLYNLSVSGNLSSATYSGVSKTVAAQSVSPHGIDVSPNGQVLILSDDGQTGSTGGIYEYSMSSDFGLSSLSYTGNSISPPSGFTGMLDSAFSSDGLKLFCVMYTGTSPGLDLLEVQLSSAYSLSGSPAFTSNSLKLNVSDVHSVEVSPDGLRLYILSVDGNTLYEYVMTEADTLSSAELSSRAFSISDQASITHGFCFSQNGNNFYAVDDPSDAAYQYSMTCYQTTSNGYVEVRVNGVTVIAESGVKTTITENKEYSSCSLHFGSDREHGVTTNVDDFYIWNSSGSWNNSFLGDRRCYFLKPNQDTSIADFDPSSGSFGYKMIDDDSPDDDSSYIIAEAYLQSGSPLTGTSEFKIENLQNGSSLISGINIIARASKTDNTSAEIYTSINSGSDSLSANAHVLTTSYRYYNDIYEYDPETMASLTRDKFNSISVSVTADDLDPGSFLESPADEVGSPTDNDPTIPTDFDARYLMNEASGSPTLVDQTGNFNGTTNTVTSVSGVESTGLRTTGVSPSRMNIPAIPTDPTVFALSGWCKVDSATGAHHMLSHRDDITALIQLRVLDSVLVYQARSSTSSLVVLNSESAIIGSYFHFVLNWNKTGTTEVWINNTLVYEDATNFSGNFNSTLSTIGPYNDSAYQYTGPTATAGNSDLYTVWRTRNLSPSEISQLYNEGAP